MSRFTIGFILIFTTLAVIFFLINPQWEAIARSRLEVQRLQALNEELTDLAEQRDLLTKEYNAISEADLEKLHSIAPQDPQTGTALIDLEALTTKNSVVLSRIDFTAADAKSGLVPTQARPFVPLGVSMGLRGTYSSVRSLLVDLEHALRMFEVVDLSFGALQTANDQLQITLKGQMYYRP